MTSKGLARVVAASIARRQHRGLVDDAAGLTDVVIHGRVDLLAVAEDLIGAAAAPVRQSWPAWFAVRSERQRETLRQLRRREALADRLGAESDPAAAAIARLRLRAIDGDDA